MPNDSMVITVSRQEGSGGNLIARQLAQQLKYTFVDDQIIRLAAGELGVTEEELDKLDGELTELADELSEKVLKTEAQTEEDYSHWINFTQNAATANQPTKLLYNYHRVVGQVIMQLAEKGRVVIVGRGANFVLKDRPDLFSIMIYAPLQNRVERLAYLAHISQEEAIRQIRKADATRSRYIQEYFRSDFMDPVNYNLMVNTANQTLEVATKAIWLYFQELRKNQNRLDPVELHHTYDLLAAKQVYTVEEAATLLMTSPTWIRSAIWQGNLKANIQNHHIIGINKQDLIDWVRNTHQS